MIWLQRTIEKSVSMEGKGLHSGQNTRLHLSPAEPNTGLVFVVPGPDGSVSIPALVENVLGARWQGTVPMIQLLAASSL